MDVKITNARAPHGDVTPPSSKSEAHRLLICQALSLAPGAVRVGATNDDIEATASALRSLGADMEYDGENYILRSVEWKKGSTVFCRESGSTLRFLLPVAASLGLDAVFTGSGRLPERPLSPLYELMCANGVTMSEKGVMPLHCKGRLTGDRFDIDGSVSSQFITGLLLSAPLIGNGVTVNVTGRLESRPYIDVTVDAMRRYGIDVITSWQTYSVSGKYRPARSAQAMGDWSSAAFWIVAGTLSDKGIRVFGLDPDSAQGDKQIIGQLRSLGANVRSESDRVIACRSDLKGALIDCADTPDLVPALSVAAAFADGVTVFENVARLRSKESDRIAAVEAMLNGFGIRTESERNTLRVYGGVPKGSEVDSFGDHRIAMAGALLACCSGSQCVIKGAGCVSKSYPAFFDHLGSLGVEIE